MPLILGKDQIKMKTSFLDNSKIKPGMSIEELAEITLENIRNLEKAYPDDIPNNLCDFAIISGIHYQSDRKLEINHFEHFISTPYEDVYIWKKEQGIVFFVSKVNNKVKEINIWKTFGLIMSLCFAWSKGFEHTTDEVVYHWVYRFEPSQKVDDLDFYDNDSLSVVRNGVVVSNLDLIPMIKLFTLLSRDEKILNSIINFNSSMQLSYCCLFCELSSSSYKWHPSHEPKIWERLSVHNNYETAILLACKSVENILGKPPRKKNKDSVVKFKELWTSLFEFDPDSLFEKTSISFIDFYYELFSLRNDSAHANYKKSFELERKKVMQAQCFAAIILFDYINSHLPGFDESCVFLKMNKEIIQQMKRSIQEFKIDE